MSEGDVSLIHDEDVLRRMWQQTEDFSRKKEIRAHMYRLREDRLRNLYSPEPSGDKGCEFTSPQGHVQSFADQSFQSMKSKEVRDAGSPPKEFTYRGQDLKELSNAGWNVESENRTSDDGHTRVKSVHANIEGRYDVPGGVGQFAAVDHNKQARTEYRDDNSSLKRDETSSSTAAHEQVLRKTDDGTQFSSTTSSSSTSKVQQVSTRHETVPYTDDFDHTYDTNRNEQLTRNRDYEQGLRKDDHGNGELVSRKVEYPDDNTRVIVETRCLPDGTRVTSTRREFRAPAQSTRSEQRSQTTIESKYNTQKKSDHTSTSKATRHSERVNDIVDSQRNVDDYDFKRQIANYTENDDFSETQSVRRHETNKRVIDSKIDDNYSQTSRNESKINRNVINHTNINDDNLSKNNQYEKVDRKVIDRSQTDDVDHSTTRYETERKVIDHSLTDDIDLATARYETKKKVIKHSQTDNVDNSTTRHETKRQVIDRSNTDDVDHSSTRYEKTRKVIDRSQTDDIDYCTTQNESNRKVIDRSGIDDDYSHTTRYVTKTEKVIDHSIVDDDIRKNQHYENVDDVDRREIMVTRDDRNMQKTDMRDTKHVINTEERIHTVTKDKKEKVIEKTTTSDQHQTTYQTDYPQKKISNDWSPSHQAWASTLRSDTPITRPSTRASSPGSRTFKSSTSSLRSSVSPDKASRKPLSRGSSPTKVDRYSPVRTVSDRYSSTHSTQTVTETKTIKQADKRPPTGRSPTRPGYSPDRKPQDRPRPSVSPEKKPQDLNQRPSASPERKPTYKPTDGYPSSPTRPAGIPSGLRQSPERKPGYKPSDGKPKDSSYPAATSPYRSSPERKTTDDLGLPIRPSDKFSEPRQNPEKKPDHRPDDVKTKDSSYPRATSPYRSSPERKSIDHSKHPIKPNQSPDRKSGQQKPVDDRSSPISDYPRTTSPSRTCPSDNKIIRPSSSPGRKPDYQTTDLTNTRPTDKTSPRSSVSPDRKPGYMRPTASSQASPSNFSNPNEPSLCPDGKSSSNKLPDDHRPEDNSRITSVKEDHYKFIDEETKMYTRTDITDITDKSSTIIRNGTESRVSQVKSPSTRRKMSDKNSPRSEDNPRENSTSPSRKEHVSFTNKKIDSSEILTSDITSKNDFTEVITTKHRAPKGNDYPDSAAKRELSPTKYSTYDKKQHSEDVKDRVPSNKDSPQRELSPSKYGTYDKKKSNAQERDAPQQPSTPSKELSPTKYGTYDKKNIDDRNDFSPENKKSPEREPSPTKHVDKDISKLNSHREPSPKHETSKRQPHNAPKDANPTNVSVTQTYLEEETKITKKDTKDTKYDTLIQRDGLSKQHAGPVSPTKKSPSVRDSVSPTKSPTKDTKYKHTTEFLATEKTTEEINKKTNSRDRPRQLITPSSSPTRKPKTEIEPSTGQSSPTTSVSGFVYFGSPRHEGQPIVTDLDDQDFYSETTTDITTITHKRPETFEGHPQSPSKNPCRSPSPEKLTSPEKERLPRKSSLKKPSEPHQISPSEKPPSSFRISPSDERDIPSHTVVKKDEPASEGLPIDTTKPKPPLERRETYEDRCKKMLGMSNITTKTVSKETTYLGESEQNIHSPGVSPCISPNESVPFKDYTATKNTQMDVTDFINQEKDDILKTMGNRESVLKAKPSRESSPTKSENIVKVTSTQDKYVTSEERDKNIITKTKKVEYSKESPEKKSGPQISDDSPRDKYAKPGNESPKKHSQKKDIDVLEYTQTDSAYPKTQPTSTIKRDTLSPENKSIHESSSNQARPENLKKPYPVQSSPRNTSVSPVRKANNVKYPTTETSKYDITSKEHIQESLTSKSIETKSSTLKSPIREILKEKNDNPDHPRTTSQSKTKPSDVSSMRKSMSPHRKEQSPITDVSNEKLSDPIPTESSPTEPNETPRYMKATSAVTSRYDVIATAVDTEETVTSKTSERKYSHHSKSPSRQLPRDDTLKSTSDYPRTMSPSRIMHSTDSSPENQPEHKDPTYPLPAKDAPARQPRNKDSSPEKNLEYVKTSTSVTSKYDTTSNRDINTTVVTETEHNKYSRKPSETPNRHIPRENTPKSTTETTSPSRSRQSADKSPEKNPQRVSSPTKDALMKEIDKKKTTKQTVERTVSPSKLQEPKDSSPERKPRNEPSPMKDLYPEKTEELHAKVSSPTKLDKSPGYIKTTTAAESIYDNSEKIQKTNTVDKEKHVSRHSESPSRPTSVNLSPDRKRGLQQPHSPTKDSPKKTPGDRYPQESSPHAPKEVPGFMRTTTTKTSKSNTVDIKETLISNTIDTKHITSRHPESPTRQIRPDHPRSDSISPSKYPKDVSPTRGSQSPEKIQGSQHPSSLTKDSPVKLSGGKYPEDSSITRPDGTPGYMRTTTAVSSKYDITSTNEDIHETTTSSKLSSSDTKPEYMKPTTAITSKYKSTITADIQENATLETKERLTSPRSSASPTRKPTVETIKPDQQQKPEEPRQLRTPSPIKKNTKITEVSTDFIASEREQEVLDRVQKSLRKLSPERKAKSPSRERSPTKETTSLHDLHVTETVRIDEYSYDDIKETLDKAAKVTVTYPDPKEEKSREPKTSSKPSSRNVSPTKKPGIPGPIKVEKTAESPTKSRSISPKKPLERPHSPQVPKISGTQPKQATPSHLTRKPTPITITASRVEKSVTADVKKTIGVIKQNSTTKSTVKTTASKFMQSPTSKIELEIKQVPITKRIRDTVAPKKDTDIKVTRTVSDITMKYKKTSPQRMKSKPEIQVNDMSTTKTSKINKPTKEPQAKFPSKPKSATALNTSTDEDDDVIIDVQQSKSSRENSPDRICPTPINFSDDVGTPRFPDEVSEPDDEFRKRTHHTIHEAESIVDDIVEICEDDELFSKRTNVEDVTEYDDSLLSVHDKVSKFKNKIETVTKPKDTTSVFKDTEKRVHSDFISENLKTDECLLSVSEKVNKFAKGPRDTRDSKSPSRKIVDEYDKDTVYQDHYTKLSVNDKAHLFVETAENVKVPKVKSIQKVQRPDLTNVDDSLKSDDCLLSVSDKVNKFVKTAEQFLTESQEVDEKEKRIKEQHDKIMKQIVDDSEDETIEYTEMVATENVRRPDKNIPNQNDKPGYVAGEPTPSQTKIKQHSSPNLKPIDRSPPVKITTLRSSEAVKKAKALFENIASTTTKTKESTKVTKLTDIGVSKKSPKTDISTIPHPSAEEQFPKTTDADSEVDAPYVPTDQESTGTPRRSDDKPRSSPSRLAPQPPEMPRSKSPMRHIVESSTSTTAKTVVTKYPGTSRAESPRQRIESDKTDKVPGYLRPTKTSQIKEEKVVEETEVSNRRGSGKFGIELRRTSVERATASTERRRSVEHPCIEDIFDLDLLEQMLEKVVGYEQRRRIRAQIRVAKKEHDSNTITKTVKTTVSIPKSRSPEPHRSPDRTVKLTPQKTSSPDRRSTPQKTVKQPNETLILNGHSRETIDKVTPTQRPHSPEKSTSKSTPKVARQPSPDKKTRPQSPSKAVPKSKSNRFSEYASAYMKKVGLNEATKAKIPETKKKTEVQHKSVKQVEEQRTIEEFSTTKNITERTSSKDVIEVIEVNGKRSPSPEKRQSPERQYSPERKQSPERRQRSPIPEVKRQKSDTGKKETIIKTVYEIEKKGHPKTVQEEKPSWVTNRNLKKITSETRTFSSKKLEPEKPKYRASSPSKVISKPIDVITSSYGPGPLDADGKPLFGIKALRNGGSNYQVKGTVVRSEFHSRNGGEPSGSVSVTAYSSQPEELEQLLQAQGAPPSRLHGLAAITTTRKFGGDTGTTIQQAHGKEERAAIDQFTHSDRRVSDTGADTVCDTYETLQDITGDIKQTLRETIRITDDSDLKSVHSTQTEKVDRRKEGREREERRERMESREDKKTVRQSSVKSLTEKYIKSASETAKSDRSAYPKAGLILRTATVRDSVSSDSSAHAGLARTDSEHSLGSVDDAVVTTTTTEKIGDGVRTVTTERVGDGVRTTTTTSTSGRQERSFLDSNTKVTGVQDILTRMKNADIVIQEGDTNEDAEARALLNKFLGATVLMAGMQGYVADRPEGRLLVQQETVRTSGGKVTSSCNVEELDLDQCWDERVLRKLLDECTDYELRRRLRARIRTLMAEQEACTNAVTEALSAAGEVPPTGETADGGDTREEEEVTVTSSVRRDSSEKTVSSTTTTKTSKVIESMTRPAPKPVSPFAKFRQLEKQNSTNSPNSPKTPQSPGSPSQPYFKFTDPALQASALTIKERLLQWCRDKTRDYENVKLENFSTSWADGLAFCALLHHFLPQAFDYSKLTPDKRRHNFTLAFKIADEKAGIYPLLDVDDMVAMRKPDWKCVFTYVQSIHRRFKDQD